MILENAIILVGDQLVPVEGYLKVENGIIEEIQEGTPSESGRDLKTSIILPPFVNSHTHIGDSVRKEIYIGKIQDEVVGKNGIKFQTLRENPPSTKIEAMKNSLREMKRGGVFAHCDFREGGISGTKLLRRAEIESVNSIALSRLKPEENLAELLKLAEGIGLPSLEFSTEEKIVQIASEVNKRKKFLSVHVSETKSAHQASIETTGRTEVERALALDPTFLVHGVWSTEEDLKCLRRSNVPLVICPRSNSLLGSGLPPIGKALEEGVELWLGTDNVSVCSPILLEELSYAWKILRLENPEAGAREARKLLKGATVNPAKRLGLPFGSIKEGERAKFVVISRNENLRRIENLYVGIVNRSRFSNVRSIKMEKN